MRIHANSSTLSGMLPEGFDPDRHFLWCYMEEDRAWWVLCDCPDMPTLGHPPWELEPPAPPMGPERLAEFEAALSASKSGHAGHFDLIPGTPDNPPHLRPHPDVFSLSTAGEYEVALATAGRSP